MDTEKKRLHKKQGLCVFCSDPAKYPFDVCERHWLTRKAAQLRKNAKIRQRYRSEGRCISCSAVLDEEVDKGVARCYNCRGEYRVPSYRRNK
jgi:hypothetical protein